WHHQPRYSAGICGWAACAAVRLSASAAAVSRVLIIVSLLWVLPDVVAGVFATGDHHRAVAVLFEHELHPVDRRRVVVCPAVGGYGPTVGEGFDICRGADDPRLGAGELDPEPDRANDEGYGAGFFAEVLRLDVVSAGVVAARLAPVSHEVLWHLCGVGARERPHDGGDDHRRGHDVGDHSSGHGLNPLLCPSFIGGFAS